MSGKAISVPSQFFLILLLAVFVIYSSLRKSFMKFPRTLPIIIIRIHMILEELIFIYGILPPKNMVCLWNCMNFHLCLSIRAHFFPYKFSINFSY